MRSGALKSKYHKESISIHAVWNEKENLWDITVPEYPMIEDITCYDKRNVAKTTLNAVSVLMNISASKLRLNRIEYIHE